jgi:hypothetical protein
MALLLGKAGDGVYRMTVPQGGWEKLSRIEGSTMLNLTESFVSVMHGRATGNHEPHRCGAFAALAAVRWVGATLVSSAKLPNLSAADPHTPG